jgi:hypothetical protein
LVVGRLVGLSLSFVVGRWLVARGSAVGRGLAALAGLVGDRIITEYCLGAAKQKRARALGSGEPCFLALGSWKLEVGSGSALSSQQLSQLALAQGASKTRPECYIPLLKHSVHGIVRTRALLLHFLAAHRSAVVAEALNSTNTDFDFDFE